MRPVRTPSTRLLPRCAGIGLFMGGRRSSASSAPNALKGHAAGVFVATGDCLMSSKPAGQHTGQPTGLGRALSLEIVRVTERAAVAAARLRGRGAEKMSDQAA